MSDKSLLSKVERALSSAWGGAVQLAVFEEPMVDHPHVTRLAVQTAPASAPPTVFLKRSRSDGEDRFSSEYSASHLFNDWAGIEFLFTILGNESPAPQIYVGDQQEGFFVTEDLAGSFPLKALWGSDSAEATKALIHYGELLGLLHGKTAPHFDAYVKIQHHWNIDYFLASENYADYLNAPVKTLQRLGLEFPPSALADIAEAADKLSNPGEFAAFTHGDPVVSNIFDCQGRWRLIDFEAARFRNALLEGIYPRMIFPTSGLRDVLRIPESAWRQSEAAYRTALSQYIPETNDDSIYGAALTAACAFWVLSFCNQWLEMAITGDAPLEKLNHIRQCTITRLNLFVTTTREFDSLTSLGNVFEGLLAKLCSQWPEEAHTLPLYPVFNAPLYR